MLFIVDNGPRQSKIVDGAFRVKRVCMDSQIIQKFIADGPFVTPVKVNRIVTQFFLLRLLSVFCCYTKFVVTNILYLLNAGYVPSY
jgi:hypothetical protein